MTHPRFEATEVLVPADWKEYALLDSGGGRKLERWGPLRLVRPERLADWEPHLPATAWEEAHAEFRPPAEKDDVAQGGKVRAAQPGAWMEKNMPQPETPFAVAYNELRFRLHLSPSGQVGLFPENASQWDWMRERLMLEDGGGARVLSLFSYTGGGTLSAAQAGAHVTHVDASHPAIGRARENQALSGLADKPIRWIREDCLRFAEREVRRGNQYEGIVLDPPYYGRGASGETWRLLEHLPRLLAACQALLSDRALFMVLTTDVTHSNAMELAQQMGEALADRGGTIEHGELGVREESAGRVLACSCFARWACDK